MVNPKEVRIINGKNSARKHLEVLLKSNFIQFSHKKLDNMIEHANYIEKVHTLTERMILFETLCNERDSYAKKYDGSAVSIAMFALLIAVAIPISTTFFGGIPEILFLIFLVFYIFSLILVSSVVIEYFRNLKFYKQCNYYISLLNIINFENKKIDRRRSSEKA